MRELLIAAAAGPLGFYLQRTVTLMPLIINTRKLVMVSQAFKHAQHAFMYARLHDEQILLLLLIMYGACQGISWGILKPGGCPH